MEARRDGGTHTLYNPTIRCIAHRTRRETLKLLIERKTTLAVDRLLKVVIATETGMDASASDDVRRLYVDLVHNHLPALKAAGLISWNREAGTVELAAHSALSDPRFEILLDIDSEGIDDVYSGLSHEYRRLAIVVLESAQARLSITELGKAVSDKFAGVADPATVSSSLYHAHLPKLARGDFIEFDVETGSSVYSTHPALEEVLTVIYEPDVYLVDRFDGFLDGLQDALPESGLGESQMTRWPCFWSESPDG